MFVFRVSVAIVGIILLIYIFIHLQNLLKAETVDIEGISLFFLRRVGKGKTFMIVERPEQLKDFSYEKRKNKLINKGLLFIRRKLNKEYTYRCYTRKIIASHLQRFSSQRRYIKVISFHKLFPIPFGIEEYFVRKEWDGFHWERFYFVKFQAIPQYIADRHVAKKTTDEQ